MTRRRAVWLTVAAIIMLLIAGALLLGLSAHKTVTAGQKLQTDISQVKQSLNPLDTAAALQALTTTAADATAAKEATSTPAWGLIEHLPYLGDSAKAATTFAAAAADISAAALPIASAINQSEGTPAKAATLLTMQPELTQLLDTLKEAANSLNGYNPQELHFGLADALTQAQDTLPGLVDSLESFNKAAPTLASMLGTQTPTTWLVMAQNPAEIRGSGGLFSAYLLIQVTNGEVSILESGSRKQLDNQFPEGQQIPYWDAVPPDTASTWGPALGVWASFNLIPDFPTVAELAAAGMAKRGTPVDGVVAIDPTVIAAILAGTGPVEHKGTTIDATTAQSFFTKDLYTQHGNLDEIAVKDELAMGLTYATIDAATKRPLDTASLWTAMKDAINSGHLRIWTANTNDETWLLTTPVAGAFLQHPNTLDVGFNNATGGKLDPYISREVTTDYATCKDNGTVKTQVTMTNNAPDGLPPYVDLALNPEGQPDHSKPSGYSNTLVTFYAPASDQEKSAYLEEALLNSKPVETHYGSTNARPTWTLPLELQRGQTATLELRFHVNTCPVASS